jgi:hypothetical protein
MEAALGDLGDIRGARSRFRAVSEAIADVMRPFHADEARQGRIWGALNNDGWGPANGNLVGLIAGPAGVGKTRQAVRDAHRLMRDLPYGKIFVDSHGSTADTGLAFAEGPTVFILIKYTSPSTADWAAHHLVAGLRLPEPAALSAIWPRTADGTPPALFVEKAQLCNVPLLPGFVHDCEPTRCLREHELTAEDHQAEDADDECLSR